MMRSFRLPRRAAPPSLPAPISIVPTFEFDGNDGPWSTFPIKIGTPPQTVKALVSTASSQTWAVLPQGCTPKDPANCTTARGGVFNPNTSSTWSQNQDAAGGLYPLTLETNLNVTGTGLYGYDTVSLDGQGSNGPTLTQQVVAGVATKAYYLSLFGLNPRSFPLPETSAPLPNYLTSLNQSGSIPSLSWSYTAGNQYRPGPVYGSLILGGYDSSRFVPNDFSFVIDGTNSRGFTVNIGTIVLETNDTVTILGTKNESLSAAIDSTTPYFTLPLNVCEQFEEAFGIEWDSGVQGYLVNDTLHNALQSQNTSITLNLGNHSTIPGEGFNISLPYDAFDLTAGPPLLNSPGRYFPLMRAANDSQITLGRTFLQEAYLIADHEHENFTVSQCSWNTSATSQIVAIRRPGDITTTKSHRLSGGAIAGIVVGIVVFIALVATITGILLRKKHSRSSKDSATKNPEMIVPELSTGNDPYSLMNREKDKELPQSPELDATEHKGHELDSGLYADGAAPQTQEVPYELDANTGRSLSPTTPISLLSPRSDATRLSRRELSDPASLSSHEMPSEKEEKPSPISPAEGKAAPSNKVQLEQPPTTESTTIPPDKPP